MQVLWKFIQAAGYQGPRSTLLEAQREGTGTDSVREGVRKRRTTGYVLLAFHGGFSLEIVDLFFSHRECARSIIGSICTPQCSSWPLGARCGEQQPSNVWYVPALV